MVGRADLMSDPDPTHTPSDGPAAAAPGPRYGAGRIAAIVGGSLALLVGLALLVAGGALVVVHLTQRDDDGFYTTDARRLQTATPALTAEGLKLGDGRTADKDVVDVIDATVQIRATGTGGTPLFVGIADTRDLDAYLRGTAHDEVRDISDGTVRLRRHPGGLRGRPAGRAAVLGGGQRGPRNAGRAVEGERAATGARSVLRPGGAARRQSRM